MRKFTLALAAVALTAGAAMAQDYTLNPAPGVVKDLQGITLTFPTEKVYVYENNRMPVATLENLTTGNVYYCEMPDLNVRATVAGSEYTLTFIEENDELADEVISAPGNYLLTVRSLYTGTEENPVDVDVITAEYTINYPAAYTLNPAPGVAENLQGIVLDFTADKVSFYENNRMAVAVLENLTTGKVYNCQEADLNARSTSEGAEYTLVFVDEDDEAPMVINQPGEYQLTVRGMYVGEGEDMVDLPVIVVDYTVEYPYAYTLNPEPGVAKNLQGIVLHFEDEGIVMYENNRIPLAVLENLTTGVEYQCYDPSRNTFAEGGTEYILVFLDEDDEYIEAINAPGQYKLTVRGLYCDNLTEETEDDVDLPVIVAEYTVEYPTAYVLSPLAGSSVENLQGIVLQFEDEFVGFYENNRMPAAVLENLTTGVTYNCELPSRNTFTEAKAEYTFMFADEDDEVLPITQPGQYQLTIRSMYTGTEEEPVDLPWIVADYTIPYPVAYLLDPANDAVVSEISEVTIDFYENKNIDFNGGRVNAAVITNGLEGDNEVVYVCEYPMMDTKAMSEGKVFTFKFLNVDDEPVNINAPGMYYLTIQGFVTLGLDEEGNTEIVSYLPPINAAYYVTDEDNEGTSKVVDLSTPEGVYNVYSLNGTQVVKNGSVDSLKALGKGIYVVNGHKVVIR